MTSSFALTARKQMTDADGTKTWSISKFGDPANALGGWEDHYITPGHTHECAPGWTAMPIGNPYGFMVCKKQKYPNGKGVDSPLPIDPSVYNGYNKYEADLYNPANETPRQVSDAWGFYDRVIPNEGFLHQNDYIAREVKYDGIGVNPLRTPGPRKYAEYGFSFTRDPPYKYDVQQLHQKYPIWKQEQIYMGASQEEMDKFDKTYTYINGMGTW